MDLGQAGLTPSAQLFGPKLGVVFSSDRVPSYCTLKCPSELYLAWCSPPSLMLTSSITLCSASSIFKKKEILFIEQKKQEYHFSVLCHFIEFGSYFFTVEDFIFKWSLGLPKVSQDEN